MCCQNPYLMFTQLSKLRNFVFGIINGFQQSIKNGILNIVLSIKRHWLEIALFATFYGNFHHNGMNVNSFSIQSFNLIGWHQSNEVPGDSIAELDTSNLANTYSNLYYKGKDIDTNDPEELKRIKRLKQDTYIKFYMKAAQNEMKIHGIPASITLAQGLLESNVGESKLAVRNNNHFGIKCFSKTCKKGHCSNFEDDTHKDFFRIFSSPEESFKAHSQILQKDRYKFLFDLAQDDYKGWAHGLKKAGYATDPKYGYKLVYLIEELGLSKFDNLSESNNE